MKIPLELLSLHSQKEIHQFCFSCFKESITRIQKNGLTYYRCFSCKKINERSLVFDPEVKSWITSDREYWHESAGVFIYADKKEKQILLFKRTIFPFKWTVPSGHVDTNETPIDTAKRELAEEVGLTNLKLEHIMTEKILGDSCRRGSDAHIWHAYKAFSNKDQTLQILEEGNEISWAKITELNAYDLTHPVKFILAKMYDRIN